MGDSNAKTIQKQLLRLHSFGQEFPNSGALRRLVFEFFTDLSGQEQAPGDLEVQVAIATDIAYVSPNTFPAIAAILSHLIALAPSEDKSDLWDKVRRKMRRIPYNGYLEIWLQRVAQPASAEMNFNSNEPICKIVNGDSLELWKNDWISSNDLKKALDVQKLLVGSVEDSEEVVQPEEIALFCQNTWAY